MTSPDAGGVIVEAVQADITALDVDVVVNAANEYLAHGGGVALAIALAGGRTIQEESDRWVGDHGAVSPGKAAVTSAGSMPSRWVVHVVGPIYEEGRPNEEQLRLAVTAALDAAASLGARSVALPAISAGIYGYPRPAATAVIASEVLTWTSSREHGLERVLLVGYDAAAARDFAEGLERAARR